MPISSYRKLHETITGAATVYSLRWNAGLAYGNNSFHIEWTGTLSGALSIWRSNKAEPDLTDDDDWVEDTGPTWVQPAGAAGKEFFDIQGQNALHVRIKYVNASGTGTISCWVA